MNDDNHHLLVHDTELTFGSRLQMDLYIRFWAPIRGLGKWKWYNFISRENEKKDEVS